MRTINSHKDRFRIGKHVIITNTWSNGNIVLEIGDVGRIDSITIQSFPGIGLFNIKILHMMFGKRNLSMGLDVVKQYMKVL